jgi:hypothetical protein
MSTERAEEPRPAGAGAQGEAGEPSEDELRAAYEAELSRITSTDVMLQAAVSLLNLGGRRLGPVGGAPASAGDEPAGEKRDLEQVRDAIDGVRALLSVLERRLSKELGPLRDALSQLQMAYAREAQAGGGGAQSATPQPLASEPQAAVGGAEAGQQGQAEGQDEQDKSGPGPAESSGRLWVPGR